MRAADVGGLAAAAAAMPTTDLNHVAQTATAVARQLAAGDGPVIVLSDRGGQSKDPRMVRVSPLEAGGGVTIVAIAAQGRRCQR